MASTDIMLVRDLDISKVMYDDPKKLDNGGKMIYVSLNKKPIRIQTPQCYAPFGTNIYKNDDTNVETHTLELSFDGKETKQNISDFFEKMKTFDELNVTKGFEYKQS